MKIARPILAAVAVGVVLAVVFAGFAIELSSTQTRARNQIKTEVNDRAVLAGSLLDSLFKTVEGNGTQYTTLFGDPSVSVANLDQATSQSKYAYSVVTDSAGNIIGASTGYDAKSGLAVSPGQIARVASRTAAYFLGDFKPYGSSTVADFLVPFKSKDGSSTRVLISGLVPDQLTGFFGNELKTVPGVAGEINYLLDGQARVLAASSPKIKTGALLTNPSPAALAKKSGSYHGSYFQSTNLANSGWRIVLVAPEAELFSSVNGARQYVPWIIFAALVLVAIVAGLLGWRVLRSAEVVTEVNERLAAVNRELSVANDSLHRRAAELARSNEELDSFASIASHDLQEPLRKVRTFTEQLTVLEADRLSDKGRDYLSRANAAAERMQRLIEDLLRFSRVSTQGRPFEQVDLAEVAGRVLLDLEAQVEEAGAQIHLGPLPVISADPLQMQQLLQNLISNALKFRRDDVTPTIRVEAHVADGKMRLTVVDNGIGFEPRYAARIFRIFERLHGRTDYPGTGIGLALCRKIADRHGGTIEAASQLGQGATFTVVLPVEQPQGSIGFGLGDIDADARREVEAGANA